MWAARPPNPVYPHNHFYPISLKILPSGRRAHRKAPSAATCCGPRSGTSPRSCRCPAAQWRRSACSPAPGGPLPPGSTRSEDTPQGLCRRDTDQHLLGDGFDGKRLMGQIDSDVSAVETVHGVPHYPGVWNLVFSFLPKTKAQTQYTIVYFEISASPCSRIDSPLPNCSSVITKGTSTRTTLL